MFTPKGKINLPRLVPKDWYDQLEDFDPKRAWLLVHRQVQSQLFANRYMVITDPSLDAFFNLWQTYVRKPPRLPKDLVAPEPSVYIPLGPLEKLCSETTPRFRGKMQQSWKTPGQEFYRAVLHWSKKGVTKEVEVEIRNVFYVSTPPIGPNEVEVNLNLLSEMRNTPGKTPNHIYVIHDVVKAEKIAFRLQIGENKQYFVYENHLLGFDFAHYTNFHPDGRLLYPISKISGLDFTGIFRHPTFTSWPTPANTLTNMPELELLSEEDEEEEQ